MRPRENRCFVGLDLGSTNEFTAVAVIERPCAYLEDPPQRRRPPHSLRHLERFAPGTPYPEIFRRLMEILKTDPLPGCELVVDQTAVGHGIVQLMFDMLIDRVTCHITRLTLTAGHEPAIGERGGWHLPKRELVGTMQSLLQTRRLLIAPSLPEATVLLKELELFRAKTTLAKNVEELDWRERPHDDLVLAVAAPAWLSEATLPRLDEEPDPPTMFLRP